MTSSDSAVTRTTPRLDGSIAVTPRQSLRESVLLAAYHVRLLNWWLVVLMALGFLVAGVVMWLQTRTGGPEGLARAANVSRFVMEPGAGLLAAMLTSALVIGDPLLEVTLATRTGIGSVLRWRALLVFSLVLVCSAAYLAWSLASGVRYAREQNALYLLLVWLAPVLVMGALGLLGAVATGNAALGMVIATIPLVASLFAYPVLVRLQAAHPFLLSYTYSGGQNASDWWINRLTLLGLAAIISIANWRLLRREELLLSAGR